MIKEKEARDKHREKLNKEKDLFSSKFLQTHNYSYCANTEFFFHYDGMHYTIYNEDDIHHEILESITNGKKLMSIKYKTKANILKQIKERSPFRNIPDSATIQFVINSLYPTLFKDKDGAKYFLHVIGDCILKKNENLVYIIPLNAKSICKDIVNHAYNLLGMTNILNNIKFKYYDHNYQDCRLILTNQITKKTRFTKNKFTIY